MRFGQINHIDIVADTGAIGCIVVITEDGEFLADAHSRLCNERNQVVGHTIGQFANQGRGMRSDRIEISQDNALDGSSTLNVVVNNLFVNLLGIAIGRCGLLVRSIFRYRQVLRFRLPIHGAWRREDNAFYIVFRHEFQQVNQRHDVIAIVEQGLLHTFAYRLWCSKVYNALNVGVFLEHILCCLHIAQVNLLKIGANTCYLLNTVEYMNVWVRQVVDNDNLVTCLNKFYRGVRTDKTSSTCY